jgi:hypothetical protein
MDDGDMAWSKGIVSPAVVAYILLITGGPNPTPVWELNG